MMELDDLERAAGLDPDSPDYRLRQALAEADDQLLEDLVRLRKEKGLTQQVVAARMKRDKAAVSNFERLSADPHQSTIRRYAAAIGASIEHRVEDFDAIDSAECKNVLEGRLDDALGQWHTYFMSWIKAKEAAKHEEPSSTGGLMSPARSGNVIYLDMHRKGVPARRAQECAACDG